MYISKKTDVKELVLTQLRPFPWSLVMVKKDGANGRFFLVWPSASRSFHCCNSADSSFRSLFIQQLSLDGTYAVAAWRSGNSVGRINEVTLRRARLVLGWVMRPGSTPGGGTLFRFVTSQPGRLSFSSFRGR